MECYTACTVKGAGEVLDIAAEPGTGCTCAGQLGRTERPCTAQPEKVHAEGQHGMGER